VLFWRGVGGFTEPVRDEPHGHVDSVPFDMQQALALRLSDVDAEFLSQFADQLFGGRLTEIARIYLALLADPDVGTLMNTSLPGAYSPFPRAYSLGLPVLRCGRWEAVDQAETVAALQTMITANSMISAEVASARHDIEAGVLDDARFSRLRQFETRPTKLIGTLPLGTMTLPGVMPACGTAGTQAFLASGQTTGVQEV
jgi:hypothetical protein